MERDERNFRVEMNRRVQSVLVRHAVDLSKLRWSSSRKAVHFSGELMRDPEREFDTKEVLALVRDLVDIPPGIQMVFFLDNIDVSAASGSWQVRSKKKK